MSVAGDQALPIRAESQLGELRDQLDAILSMLRWLWTSNLAAAVAGVVMRLHWMAACGMVSFLVSFAGAITVRRAYRALTGGHRSRR